jgi:hypothetical protein
LVGDHKDGMIDYHRRWAGMDSYDRVEAAT